MTTMDKILNIYWAIMIATAAISMVIVLVVVVNDNWTLGMLFIVTCLLEMFQSFFIGTMYENVCEEFSLKILCIEWNALKPEHRIILKIILQMSQTPNLSTLGGIYPNNMDMFMRVSN